MDQKINFQCPQNKLAIIFKIFSQKNAQKMVQFHSLTPKHNMLAPLKNDPEKSVKQTSKVQTETYWS